MPDAPAPKIVVIGSLNMDHTLRVPHIPAPSETLAATAAFTCFGGKGANQALAAARAGGDATLKAAYDAARASQRAALAVPLLHRPASLNCKACLPALVTKVCSLSTGKRAQSRVISYRVKVVLYH